MEGEGEGGMTEGGTTVGEAISDRDVLDTGGWEEEEEGGGGSGGVLGVYHFIMSGFPLNVEVFLAT